MSTAKFVVADTLVTVSVPDGETLSDTDEFIVSDGTDEWYVSKQMLAESYQPVSAAAVYYVDAAEP